MRSCLLASVAVMEFHATEAYCNLCLTNVQYSARRLFREKNKNVTARINHKNLVVWDNTQSPWRWKRSLESINMYFQIFNAVSACYRKVTEFAVEPEQVCFSSEEITLVLLKLSCMKLEISHLRISNWSNTVMRGLRFTEKMDVISKEKDIWVPEPTR
jgi:hypothetical protein